MANEKPRQPGTATGAGGAWCGEALGPPERGEGESLRRQRGGKGSRPYQGLIAGVCYGVLREFIQSQQHEARACDGSKERESDTH